MESNVRLPLKGLEVTRGDVNSYRKLPKGATPLRLRLERAWQRTGQWCRPTRGGEPCRHSRHSRHSTVSMASWIEAKGAGTKVV